MIHCLIHTIRKSVCGLKKPKMVDYGFCLLLWPRPSTFIQKHSCYLRVKYFDYMYYIFYWYILTLTFCHLLVIITLNVPNILYELIYNNIGSLKFVGNEENVGWWKYKNYILPTIFRFGYRLIWLSFLCIYHQLLGNDVTKAAIYCRWQPEGGQGNCYKKLQALGEG